MNKKKYAKLAKSLFKESLTFGYLNYSKVKKILAVIASAKIAGKVPVLKAYQRQVQNQLKKEEVVVEVGQKFSPSKNFESQLLAKTAAKAIKYKQNPDIVFGAKISFGDWIYDSTLSTKLEQLAIND